MAAEDELALPQVPEAKPDDPEDVSWSLSTAEAMWARGDHLEGIKWVRKAAEAASDVENDERALELAKAASDLATIIARRSRASIDEGPGLAGGAPPEATYTAPPPMSATPTTTRSHAPPPPVTTIPSSPPPPISRSSPPIPLPSMVNQAPRASTSLSGRAPRPLAALDSQATKPKPRRRSRENLDAEAKAAGVTETAPMRAVDGESAARTLNAPSLADDKTIAVEVPVASPRTKRRMRSDPEPTVVARLEDLEQHRERSAQEWDASPTENLTGDEMDHHMTADGDRKTTAFVLPSSTVAVAAVTAAPVRPQQPTIHDPGIQTTQAVRVVVWRDATGVHVAPAGTVVSSITIDAVLVVLEEGADLTAWLSQR